MHPERQDVTEEEYLFIMDIKKLVAGKNYSIRSRRIKNDALAMYKNNSLNCSKFKGFCPASTFL